MGADHMWKFGFTQRDKKGMNHWLIMSHVRDMVYLVRPFLEKQPCGVNRKMLVHHVLSNHKTSESLYRTLSRGKWQRGNGLTVIQEIAEISDGPRGELSRVKVNIHEYKVLRADEMEVKLSSQPA